MLAIKWSKMGASAAAKMTVRLERKIRGLPVPGGCRLIDRKLIADILQQPLGGNFFAEPFLLRELVDLAGDGEELRSLDVAALGVGNLPGRRPAGLFPAEKFGQGNGAVFRDRAMRFLAGRLHTAVRRSLRFGGIGEIFIGQLQLRPAPGSWSVAEAQGHVDALYRRLVRVAADARDMRPLFQPIADDDRNRGVGTAGDDVGAAVNVARAVDRLDLDVEALADFPRVILAVLLRRAVDLDSTYLPRQQKRFGVRARHAAGAEHADDARLLLGHIFRPDAGVRADADVLEIAVVDQRERLAVLDAGEKNEAAVVARPDAIFLLRDRPVVFLLVNDIRFHADREVAGDRSALHRAPLVDFIRIGRRDLDVDARAADRLLARELRVRFLERAHRNLHREDAADVVVVENQGHAKLRILAPERDEELLVDQFLNQAVVEELLGLRRLGLGIFLRDYVERHLERLRLDERHLLDEIVRILHGAVEHPGVRDLGIFREDLFIF